MPRASSVRTASSRAAAAAAPPSEHDYEVFSAALRDRFRSTATGPLFTTDASGLYESYLAAFPAAERQHYTCTACRRFIETYGGLVAIDPNGRTIPVMWDAESAPGVFADIAAELARRVGKAKITGVFLTPEKTWGQPVTGSWHHLAVTPPARLVYTERGALFTAHQKAAEKHEDFGMLSRSLAEFPPAIAEQAHAALINGTLYRSEKCVGAAAWLVALHTLRANVRSKAAKENLVWASVAEAPAGFCHLRSTVIGTLLDDLAAGKPFAEVKRAFNAKMSPTQYQRPTAAPAAGNVAVAESIVATLRSARALERRFATLADLRPLWTPSAAKKAAPVPDGVFGQVKTKQAKAATLAPLDLPPITMTWEKFARTVLPDAVGIECLVPRGAACSFYALVTAANPDAPPILQWDREEDRNPVSWYTYVQGSPAQQWNLQAGAWVKITALSLFPNQWSGNFAHHGDGLFLVLDGARDTAHTAGAGFFVEMLRSEYHSVRATLEAHVKAARIAGRDEATACGLGLPKGRTWNVQVRVTPRTGLTTVYLLDRWD